MSKKQSVMVTILRREYQKVFVENWSSLTGGVLIGLMSIVTFAWDHPWGVAGGVRNWGDWFFYGIGLLLGALIGLKYLYWELEHLPTVNSVENKEPSTKGSGWDYWQPILGFGLILGAFWANEIYSLHGYIIIGGLFLCGTAFGFIMHRSRFCFERCFREPFMTGEAAATQAVIISLLICVLGFAVIKWTGLRNELAFTASSFGLGGLAGGFIFGFGMLLTGGCGSGTVWRVAEGQVKLMLALVTFALSTSLTKTLIRSTESIRSLIGWKVFLPDLFGYPLTMFSVYLIMAVWYFTVAWNEKTEFFVVQM